MEGNNVVQHDDIQQDGILSNSNVDDENTNRDIEDTKSALQQLFAQMFAKENLKTDAYLLSNMSPVMFVPLEIVQKYPRVQEITNDISIITEALRESNSVTLTEDGVRPNIKVEQNTIILRDIPSQTTIEEVQRIFTSHLLSDKSSSDIDGSGSGKGKPASSRPSIRSEVNNIWFVTFSTEAEARAALEEIRKMTFHGKPIKAALKSESLSKTFFSGGNPYKTRLGSEPEEIKPPPMQEGDFYGQNIQMQMPMQQLPVGQGMYYPQGYPMAAMGGSPYMPTVQTMMGYGPQDMKAWMQAPPNMQLPSPNLAQFSPNNRGFAATQPYRTMAQPHGMAEMSMPPMMRGQVMWMQPGVPLSYVGMGQPMGAPMVFTGGLGTMPVEMAAAGIDPSFLMGMQPMFPQRFGTNFPLQQQQQQQQQFQGGNRHRENYGQNNNNNYYQNNNSSQQRYREKRHYEGRRDSLDHSHQQDFGCDETPPSLSASERSEDGLVPPSEGISRMTLSRRSSAGSETTMGLGDVDREKRTGDVKGRNQDRSERGLANVGKSGSAQSLSDGAEAEADISGYKNSQNINASGPERPRMATNHNPNSYNSVRDRVEYGGRDVSDGVFNYNTREKRKPRDKKDGNGSGERYECNGSRYQEGEGNRDRENQRERGTTSGRGNEKGDRKIRDGNRDSRDKKKGLTSSAPKLPEADFNLEADFPSLAERDPSHKPTATSPVSASGYAAALLRGSTTQTTPLNTPQPTPQNTPMAGGQITPLLSTITSANAASNMLSGVPAHLLPTNAQLNSNFKFSFDDRDSAASHDSPISNQESPQEAAEDGASLSSEPLQVIVNSPRTAEVDTADEQEDSIMFGSLSTPVHAEPEKRMTLGNNGFVKKTSSVDSASNDEKEAISSLTGEATPSQLNTTENVASTVDKGQASEPSPTAALQPPTANPIATELIDSNNKTKNPISQPQVGPLSPQQKTATSADLVSARSPVKHNSTTISAFIPSVDLSLGSNNSDVSPSNNGSVPSTPTTPGSTTSWGSKRSFIDVLRSDRST